ncbi:hypothetical protein CAOG_06219 [Capsaspora owczarzaki ATCC 30864]|nr:hypothetical protein CAOG_06219 [Capsaspora owczarzaki ATCC 30864]|eukprot:XP_004344968.2 hypothetical protein CAOG_06219 [Capsaspora owczarzaki ATCC 30864]
MSDIPGFVTTDRDQALQLLRAYIQYDGAFLVRLSESAAGFYSIGVTSKGAIKHFKVQLDEQRQVYIAKKKFASVRELVLHYMQSPIRSNQFDDPIMLKIPIFNPDVSVQPHLAFPEPVPSAVPHHRSSPYPLPEVPPPVPSRNVRGSVIAERPAMAPERHFVAERPEPIPRPVVSDRPEPIQRPVVAERREPVQRPGVVAERPPEPVQRPVVVEQPVAAPRPAVAPRPAASRRPIVAEQQPRQQSPLLAVPERPAPTSGSRSPLPNIPRVSMQVLAQVTSNFADTKKIGGGGFGSVYSGVWCGQHVAVKRLAAESAQGVAQFEAELEALSRFRHPNIVTVMCYTVEGNERCLGLELMVNGSVRDRLDRKNNSPPLSWRHRQKIATETASAMHFVQTAVEGQPLFHLDLKTANILLDENFKAKVADFGLTRQAPTPIDAHSYIRADSVQGTLQYICPQYRDEGKVSIKTDVYSFGMILLELLTAAKPCLDLIGSFNRELRKKHKPDALLDTAIDWSVADKQAALVVAELAADCLELARVDRPTFLEAVQRLCGEQVAQDAHGDNHAPERDRECLICADAPTTAKLLPCRHACVCVECAQMLLSNGPVCPVCRGAIASFDQGEFDQTFVR